jgi:hypothetical protein
MGSIKSRLNKIQITKDNILESVCVPDVIIAKLPALGVFSWNACQEISVARLKEFYCTLILQILPS